MFILAKIEALSVSSQKNQQVGNNAGEHTQKSEKRMVKFHIMFIINL